MQKRYGKYLADWRDADGVRHRKAFDTLQEAAEYAEHMRTQLKSSLPNPSGRPRPSRKPPASGRARKRRTQTRKRHSRR